MAFMDEVPPFPYEAVMAWTGLTREEIDEEIARILAGLPPEERQLLRETEDLIATIDAQEGEHR